MKDFAQGARAAIGEAPEFRRITIVVNHSQDVNILRQVFV